MDLARENLRRLMAERGHSEAEAARLSGVGQTWLNRYLRGKIESPNVQRIGKLATLYGVTTEDVLFAHPAGGAASQPVRWDPDILADAMALLDRVDRIQGRPIEPRPSPARLAIACDVVASELAAPSDSVVARLADRLRRAGG